MVQHQPKIVLRGIFWCFSAREKLWAFVARIPVLTEGVSKEDGLEVGLSLELCVEEGVAEVV